ncbi:hypothetical protein HEK131_24390 [Streptomyces seoulensis]|nr:hypothetical protein HEK131_24390 [Streptomyces seoulensis]
MVPGHTLIAPTLRNQRAPGDTAYSPRVRHAVDATDPVPVPNPEETTGAQRQKGRRVSVRLQ